MPLDLMKRVEESIARLHVHRELVPPGIGPYLRIEPADPESQLHVTHFPSRLVDRIKKNRTQVVSATSLSLVPWMLGS